MAIRGLRSYIATNAVMFMGSFQSTCLRAMFHPSRRFSKFFDTEREPYAPLTLPRFSRYFPPAVAKVYIVSFRTHDHRRPSKFIVLADNMKSAINMAWEHGGRGLPIALRQNHSTSSRDERGDSARFVIAVFHLSTNSPRQTEGCLIPWRTDIR